MSFMVVGTSFGLNCFLVCDCFAALSVGVRVTEFARGA